MRRLQCSATALALMGGGGGEVQISKKTAVGLTARAALDAKKSIDDETVRALISRSINRSIPVRFGLSHRHVLSCHDLQLASIVEARLSQSDAQRNGWVLTGFPNTRVRSSFAAFKSRIVC